VSPHRLTEGRFQGYHVVAELSPPSGEVSDPRYWLVPSTCPEDARGESADRVEYRLGISGMKFRPCIDLHNGVVKQIVGGTFADEDAGGPVTRFVSEQPPSHYARMYRDDGLTGGHVIMLGPGNEDAAIDALSAWPGGLQVGGGMNPDNARNWLDRGAAAVIVTSYVFREGRVSMGNLKTMVAAAGKDRLVLDLSCRKRDGRYFVVTDHWQKFTDVEVTQSNLDLLSSYCSEFLIHAADVEGLAAGIDAELVEKLGNWVGIPTTYAGGIRSMADVYLIRHLARGRLDFTVGSALDLFGGTGIAYGDLVAFNKARVVQE